MSPRRARLWVTVFRGWGDDGDRRPLTASLLDASGGSDPNWRQLDRARVKIRDGQIMVLGYEDHGYNPKSPRLVPQVWWCDPVREPLDEREALAKAKFPPTAGKLKRAAPCDALSAPAVGVSRAKPA